nr:MAG TPA: hypothetical protein [Caudoviricetes sp.]
MQRAQSKLGKSTPQKKFGRLSLHRNLREIRISLTKSIPYMKFSRLRTSSRIP